MLFSVVFLLNVLVFGGCHLTREEEILVKTRVAPKKPISPVCPTFGNTLLKTIGNGFMDWILQGLTKPYSKSAALADAQFAFLYLHDTDPYYYQIGNDNVDRVFSKDTNYILPLIEIGHWPDDVEKTNFLFGIPLSSAFGKPNNVGHAEYNLLKQLPEMLTGYLARHQNKCPCFVMLGTVLPPCHYKVGKQQPNGCAIDYVNAKYNFAKKCPNTVFSLFVDFPPKKAYKIGWKHTKNLYPFERIRIITRFQEN